jgi:hypothetical protein
MTQVIDPMSLQTLEALAVAERRLAEAAERLATTAPRAVQLAADTDWRTDAAVRFHASAEAWRADVGRLATLTESVRADVRRLGERLGLLAWGHGL